jgi:3',5'-cyclic AMP phosphodiesterase CpdA
MEKKVTRRQMIKTTGVAALGAAALGGSSGCRHLEKEIGVSEEKKTAKNRVLRIAHLTDCHVYDKRNAAAGLAACLHHAQNQTDKPDVIFNGGDAVMDTLYSDRDGTKRQWDLWTQVIKNECSLPIEHCIGNHDVWGWGDKEKIPDTDTLYGKKWVMDIHGLDMPYRSFDRAGWHFIFLDSTHYSDDKDYQACLDDDQFSWLEADLVAVNPNTPIMVFSHIPIFSVCAYVDGENEKSGNWVVPGRWMHIDARRIKNLFLKHGNVKVCLSGHIHLVDRVEYLGVTYLCNGAVCGGWWKGNYQECAPGYALVDLYDDGSFDNEYVTFGWQPSSE